MRRIVSVVLPAVLAIGAVLAVAGIALGGLLASPEAVSGLAEESPCVPIVTKTAHPERVLLGETVDVTLTVRTVCAGERIPLHVVLVLDASGTMAGEKSIEMKRAAAFLVRGLDLDNYPDTKVGVVEFNSSARMLSPLTNDERRVIAVINVVGASGGSRIDAGILEGMRVLGSGRGGHDNVTEVMIVVSDGANTAGCGPVLQAARQARAQGILLSTVCVDPDCDEACMRQVASGPGYFFRADQASAMFDVFDRIRDKLLNIELRLLSVTESISDSLRFVPDSPAPPPSAPIAPTTWLQWDELFATSSGVTFTYRVLPIRAGAVPVGATTGRLLDNLGRERSFTFPVPWVTVLQPVVLPTPDWTVTITPSATPTVTPSPTTTPAPTLTPTPRPRPIYMPYHLR